MRTKVLVGKAFRINEIKKIIFFVNYYYTDKQEINEFNSEKQMSDILLPSYDIIESNNEIIKSTDNLINDSINILNECYIDVDSLIDDNKKNFNTIIKIYNSSIIKKIIKIYMLQFYEYHYY